MSRAFDSAEPDPRLVFTEIADCPQCCAEIECWFTDDSLSVEDMTDPPTGDQTCDACGYSWRATATGWSFFSEAG